MAPNERKDGTQDNDGAQPRNGTAGTSGKNVPQDPTFRALMDMRRSLASAPHPYVRQGGLFSRATSPAWDLTSLRIRRVAGARFEAHRGILALNGRVPPHGQAFEVVLDAAERSLPPELRALLET